MISVEKLWNRLKTLTKSGTSGYFTEADFNSNLYSTQYSILSLLCDNYENNQKISDALVNHVVELSPLSSLSGGYLFPTSIETSISSYYRTLDIKYIIGGNEYPSRKIAVNEEAMYLTSPIRKPDITKFSTLYLFKNNNICTLPKTVGNTYSLIYCRKPTEAKIAFTSAENADNDYLIVNNASTVNIDFPEGLFNLFVYYMLESMGIEQRESLIQAYSELGISRTIDTDLK